MRPGWLLASLTRHPGKVTQERQATRNCVIGSRTEPLLPDRAQGELAEGRPMHGRSPAWPPYKMDGKYCCPSIPTKVHYLLLLT